MADDCKTYGTLDSFSAFPFENFLGKIKGLIRGSKKPLQQAYCRLIEMNQDVKLYVSTQDVKCLYEHISMLRLHFNENCTEYKKVMFNNFSLTICSYSIPDSYFLTREHLVVQIYNVIKENFKI